MAGISVEDLKCHYSVEDHQLQLQCLEAHFEILAHKVPNWLSIAIALGLNKYQQQAIKVDSNLDYLHKNLEVLKVWKENEGHKATYLRLVQACLKINNAVLAGEVCKLAKEENVPDSVLPTSIVHDQLQEEEQMQLAIHTFCTKNLITRKDAPYEETLQNTQPATLHTDHLWRDVKELKVYFMNGDQITNWKHGDDPLSISTILSWVDLTWNQNAKKYPKISTTPASQAADAHIKIKFDSTVDRSHSCLGSLAKAKPPDEPTMVLDLLGDGKYSKRQQIHLVLHEFGHALGLEHEHQRSDFCSVLFKEGQGAYKFIIGKEEMKNGNGDRCLPACSEVFEYENVFPLNTSHSEYDSDSIMHYWYDINWLKPEYRDCTSAEYKKLTPEEKKVIDGVHRRNIRQRDFQLAYPKVPSPIDYEHLNKAYGEIAADSELNGNGTDIAGAPPKIKENAGCWCMNICFCSLFVLLLALVIAYIIYL